MNKMGEKIFVSFFVGGIWTIFKKKFVNHIMSLVYMRNNCLFNLRYFDVWDSRNTSGSSFLDWFWLQYILVSDFFASAYYCSTIHLLSTARLTIKTTIYGKCFLYIENYNATLMKWKLSHMKYWHINRSNRFMLVLLLSRKPRILYPFGIYCNIEAKT